MKKESLYSVRDGCMLIQTGSAKRLLTNFAAHVTEYGYHPEQQQRLIYYIDAVFCGDVYKLMVPADQFRSMKWISFHPAAALSAEISKSADHAANAIKSLSLTARRIRKSQEFRMCDYNARESRGLE